MARLTRRLRREKTNARVIPGSTVFDAPGMFLPRYGKSHFLISGTGQPGTVLVAGNQVYNNDGNAVTNASTPGNIIGYNPPTGGNAVGNNPPTVGDYVLQVYELQTGPGPDGPNSSYENYSTEAGYGPHDPGYSTYGVFPAYDGTPPSTQYLLFTYADTFIPGNTRYSPVVPGTANYNPSIPGNAVYNPPTNTGASVPFVALGVTFPGAVSGAPGSYVPDTLTTVTYSVGGAVVEVPPGAQVVVKQQF